MQTLSVIILCLKISIVTKQNQKIITCLKQQQLKMPVHKSNNVSVLLCSLNMALQPFLIPQMGGKDTGKVLYQFKWNKHLSDDTTDLTYSFTLLNHSEGGAVFKLGAFWR